MGEDIYMVPKRKSKKLGFPIKDFGNDRKEL